MTLSPDARRSNLNEALAAFLKGLGDQRWCGYYIDPKAFPNILPTTWTELTKRNWLRDMNMNVEMYQFTSFGYVKALETAGLSEDPHFREQLGKLCAVLKDSLKGRTDFTKVVFQDLVQQSGVSEAFAYNAIDADLIQHVLGRIGATWSGENLIRVPRDFGHTLI